jgi:hypothetical protein
LTIGSQEKMKGMELASQEKQKALELQQAAKFKEIDQNLEAGKFDETQRQELIKMVAQKDPNLALQLSGMSVEQISAAKVENPNIFQRIGSFFTGNAGSKVALGQAKGKDSPQYKAAMAARETAKGVNTARR